MNIERSHTNGIMKSLDYKSPQSPSLYPRGYALSYHHSMQSTEHSVQQLFIDVSTELLRQGQSIKFQAPGRSMYPTIKEGETITVVPVALFDIKRGDILLYLVGSKVIAHRVVSIERKKDDLSIHSSTLNPQHLFLLRGDASGTCDDLVEAQQVLGKVISVERRGCSIDLYNRKARMLRILHAWASRLKRLILRVTRISGRPGSCSAIPPQSSGNEEMEE